MVAVKSHADRFITRPPGEVFLFLFYGSDAGLITERARNIIARTVADPKDPFALVRITGDELAADPQRLADEANTIPLFGGKRAIWIEAQGKSFVAAIEPVLKVPPSGCAIVIEAAVLKKDAPLRLLCERSPCAAAIPCYPDSPQDIEELIAAEAAAASLAVTPQAKRFLASQLGQDRLATRLELEKLMLYAHGATAITLDHVQAIVAETSELAAGEAVDSAFSGDLEGLDARLQHIFAGAGDHHMLLAAALRHALDLHRLSCGAGGQGRRGPGFKETLSFERQARQWTRKDLSRAIGLVAAAIAQARREPRLGPCLAEQVFWTIAKIARRKPARG